MAAAERRTSGWSSPSAAMGLAVAASLLVLAACATLVYYAGSAVDRLTEARETRLMERSIDRRLARLKDDIASVAIWTEAYDKTVRAFDPEWAHVNYGNYHQLESYVAVGMDGHIAKPLDIAALFAAIDGVLSEAPPVAA